MTEKELKKVISNCKNQNINSQKELYKHFYGYTMSIAIRYSSNREEAEEILNDSFLKVFSKIKDHYDDNLSFKGWFRRIIINTSIDYYRKNNKMQLMLELPEDKVSIDESALEKISADEILKLIQQLSPGYRTVFNLYCIEGFKHYEIAEMLSISEGTSKSNLFKARLRLQQMIKINCGVIKLREYGG